MNLYALAFLAGSIFISFTEKAKAAEEEAVYYEEKKDMDKMMKDRRKERKNDEKLDNDLDMFFFRRHCRGGDWSWQQALNTKIVVAKASHFSSQLSFQQINLE